MVSKFKLRTISTWSPSPTTWRLTALALFVFYIFSLIGCSHASKNVGPSETQTRSDRAPSEFVIGSESQTTKPVLDATYLQTQADYHYAMGEAYSLDGAPKKAIESFKSVLIYDADSLAVRVRLAHEYVKAGLISEAVEEAELVLQKDPRQVQARLLLGGLYSAMKMYPKAVSEYNSVIKLKPDQTEAYIYLAAVYAEQKNLDLAIQTFKRILSLPDFSNPHLIHYYVGRVYLENKQGKNGLAALEQSLKLKPSFVEAAILQAQYLLENSQTAAAEKILKDYHLKQGPREKVAELLSQIYLEQERYDDAYEMLSFLEENSADDILNVKLKLALIMIQRKMYAPAALRLEDILKIAPESDKVRFYLGAVYEEMNNPEQALLHFKLVPASSSFYEDSLNHAAIILKKEQRDAEAIRLIESALTDNPEMKTILPTYVSLLESQGQFEKALNFVHKVLEKDPQNHQLRFFYGNLFDRVGKKDDVIAQMKMIIEAEPDHVQALNYLAYTWAEMGIELNAAEKYAAKAVSLEPQDPYILDTLGWIYFKQNRLNEAMKTLEAAHKFKNDISIVAEHLGDVYMKVAFTDKARKMYLKAIALETDPKKIQELQSKVTSLESQKALLKPRSPASIDQPGEE